jgi:hypothetical protein
VWRSVPFSLPIASLASGLTAGARAQLEGQLTYERSEIVPPFQLGGKPTRIHTQGLYVTEKSYYVTGRLEREPKQPLLLRIDRSTRRQVESINLATAREKANGELDALDHPSGFDFDGHFFWIALAVSHPESRSVVIRVSLLPDHSLGDAKVEPVFVVKDHIGSLAVDATSNRLYGANWDTKRIYIWDTSGRLIRSASSADLKSLSRVWLPAVQDWKSIDPGRVLLGGLAKRPGSQANTDQSVLEVWDLDSLTRVRSIWVPRPKGFAGESRERRLCHLERTGLFPSRRSGRQRSDSGVPLGGPASGTCAVTIGQPVSEEASDDWCEICSLRDFGPKKERNLPFGRSRSTQSTNNNNPTYCVTVR